MLRLLTEDPYFAWLHPMSELIVDLDSLLTQELLPPGTVAGVRQEIDRLTQAGGPLLGQLRSSPPERSDVVMAHRTPASRAQRANPRAPEAPRAQGVDHTPASTPNAVAEARQRKPPPRINRQAVHPERLRGLSADGFDDAFEEAAAVFASQHPSARRSGGASCRGRFRARW